VPSRDFQQIHGADGIHVEIVERAAGCQVVAGLGSTVDDQVEWTFGPKQTGKLLAVADIQVPVAKMLRRLAKPLQVPPRVPLFTEKVCAHVIVDPDHALRAPVEEADKLRADQSTGTGNEYLHDRTSL
jgi:hypothetical protein